jgi:hypothetical protein
MEKDSMTTQHKKKKSPKETMEQKRAMVLCGIKAILPNLIDEVFYKLKRIIDGEYERRWRMKDGPKKEAKFKKR